MPDLRTRLIEFFYPDSVETEHSCKCDDCKYIRAISRDAGELRLEILLKLGTAAEWMELIGQ